MYHAATLGDRMLGHGEPIRVKQGERVLFRLLNASASMGTTLALPGHRFTVVALDGNPVPVPTAVDVLRLDVAERADVVVEMNNPGVWVFGSTDDMDRHMGLGIVVEYENQSGEPRWAAPKNARWDYTVFGNSGLAAEPDETIKLCRLRLMPPSTPPRATICAPSRPLAPTSRASQAARGTITRSSRRSPAIKRFARQARMVVL
jgi:hypothetical protein